VDGQRVGADHLDRPLELGRAHGRFGGCALRDQLGGAQIADQKGVGRGLTRDRVAGREPGLAQRGALAANPHRQPVPLGRSSQPPVDLGGRAVAARHRRDRQRRPQPPAQELHA